MTPEQQFWVAILATVLFCLAVFGGLALGIPKAAASASEGLIKGAVHYLPMAVASGVVFVLSKAYHAIVSRLPGRRKQLQSGRTNSPRRSGPAPQGGNPVAMNNPNNPAGAGQAAAPQQPTPQNDGWPTWMSALAPAIVAFFVFAALLVTNLTPLYYTGLHEQLPNVWVIMQGVIAVLVGMIVWLIVRINALRMDILFMQTTHPQLKRPNDWTPPAAQPQAPANQQPNPNP